MKKQASWNKKKSSGTFRRRVIAHRNLLLQQLSESAPTNNYQIDTSSVPVFETDEVAHPDAQSPIPRSKSPSPDISITTAESDNEDTDEENADEDYYSPNEDDGGDDLGPPEIADTLMRDDPMEIFLRKWAIQFNIRQYALKVLMAKLNRTFNTHFPKDPRTLMRTPQKTPIVSQIGGGQYWHQGIEFGLRLCFKSITQPQLVDININIDGLPLYESSKDQFWPILYNFHKLPHIKPMIIGLFYGKQKPARIEEFLKPFVDDMEPILREGLTINGHKLTVKIRTFICDSPARAFIKGTVNFNAQAGCLKCCTVGIWSSILHCTIFPKTNCALRTDDGFRRREYKEHHRDYVIRTNGRKHKEPIVTPLLRLPIDIVQDITVSDSLHLLHHGVMKRLLVAYKDGHNGCSFKWTHIAKDQLSSMITQQKIPMEIHRAVRGIDEICHWKASECSVFLNYLGIGSLHYLLPENHYKMFVNLFCAVTICSSDYYRRFLPVAHKLFENFIAYHYQLFTCVTSNVHNLIHVSQECERFGALPTLSGYPFENHLYIIKNLIRSGRQPLAQVVNRLTKIMYANEFNLDASIGTKYPYLFNAMKEDSSKFSCVKINDGFTLANDNANKWFLTKNKEVIGLNYVQKAGIYGVKLKVLHNVFNQPFNSSLLNIFQTKSISNVELLRCYAFTDVLCKFVTTNFQGKTIFVPMHHTLPSL